MKDLEVYSAGYFEVFDPWNARVVAHFFYEDALEEFMAAWKAWKDDSYGKAVEEIAYLRNELHDAKEMIAHLQGQVAVFRSEVFHQ